MFLFESMSDGSTILRKLFIKARICEEKLNAFLNLLGITCTSGSIISNRNIEVFLYFIYLEQCNFCNCRCTKAMRPKKRISSWISSMVPSIFRSTIASRDQVAPTRISSLNCMRISSRWIMRKVLLAVSNGNGQECMYSEQIFAFCPSMVR